MGGFGRLFRWYLIIFSSKISVNQSLPTKHPLDPRKSHPLDPSLENIHAQVIKNHPEEMLKHAMKNGSHQANVSISTPPTHSDENRAKASPSSSDKGGRMFKFVVKDRVVKRDR